MIIAITGTPGTGKTSVCKALGVTFLDLNKIIEDEGFYSGVDEERGCFIADLDKMEKYVRDVYEERRREKEGGILLIESHLAHYLKSDVIIVLRANPFLLKERLKHRGFSENKIKENVEAETLDVILVEAAEMCEIVYEVDTSGKSVEEVADCVKQIIDLESKSKSNNKKMNVDKSKYKPGSVDWSNLMGKVFNLNDA